MRFPEAKVDAVELSKDAIEVARRNVADHGLKKRVRLLRGDLFAPVKDERYDLIISNPPYVDDEGMAGLPPECRHEPPMAFDGGGDGLSIVRRILDEAGQHLKKGGGLVVRDRTRPRGAGARLSGHALSLARYRGSRARCSGSTEQLR